MGDWDKYIKDSKFNTDNYKSHYFDKLNKNEYLSTFEKEEMGKRQRSEWSGPSAEDRAQFARERRALVGSILTQESFEGALVLEHIRGSQYLIRMPNGTEVYASHKKQNDQEASVSSAGWTRWQERR